MHSRVLRACLLLFVLGMGCARTPIPTQPANPLTPAMPPTASQPTSSALPTATQPPFSQDQAIKRASEEAKQSAPEYAPLETRVDSVTAELITLAEADKRFGGQPGSGSYAPGQTPATPVWWVAVRGYFRWEGMPLANGAVPIDEAYERDFAYDASTGQSVGSFIPGPPRLVATREAEMTVQPPPTLEAEETMTPLATESAHPEHCRVAENETYVSQESKYCFAYPSRFKLALDNSGQPVLSGPPLDQSVNPLFASLGLQVQAAPEGSNLTQVIDEYLKPFASIPGPAIARKSFQLDREAAQILEVVPGRVGSRDIFAIYEGRVYHLMFMPSVRDFPQAAQDVEELFKMVTSTFTFLP